MNQETHDIGDVYLEQDHGKIWLARSNYIGYDKIFYSSTSLAGATLSPHAQVFYKNKPIGHLRSMQYNKKDGFLVGFFTLTVSRDSLPDNDYLFSDVKYDSNGIQCIRCNRIFTIGSTSCECIEFSPVIQIPKINILGVSIHNGMNDSIDMFDSRHSLLKKYFGGMLASINLDEEGFESDNI